MAIEFTLAADLAYADLAALLERAFASYLVPVRGVPRRVEARNRAEHVDLFASRIAWRDGEPIALAMIARRGRRSRVAAMGVVAEARGTGVGTQLLDAVIEDARGRGDESLVLECFAANPRALGVYGRAGFVPTRRLVGWRSGALVPEAQPIVDVDPTELARALARSDHGSLPWQLAFETLVAVTEPVRGWTIDGSAFAVGSELPAEVSIAALFTRPEHRRQGHAARLVRGLAGRFAPRPLVMPPIVPEQLGRELAVHLGLAPYELEQVEMMHALAGRT
jgi:GNAT superfamily N-acetyltransferase